MRVVAAICASASLVLSAGVASAKGASGELSVKGVGDAAWKVSCSLQLADGKTSTPEINGRKGIVVELSKRNVAGGTCTYAGPKAGDFQLQFGTKNFACPFSNATPESCKRRITAGETGQFTLNLKL